MSILVFVSIFILFLSFLLWISAFYFDEFHITSAAHSIRSKEICRIFGVLRILRIEIESRELKRLSNITNKNDDVDDLSDFDWKMWNLHWIYSIEVYTASKMRFHKQPGNGYKLLNLSYVWAEIYYPNAIWNAHVAPLPVFNSFPRKIHCYSSIYVLTCFSNKSLLADKQVTKYFVKLKNELSTSNVRCSRDDLCNINDITRNPRFCKREGTKIERKYSMKFQWI